MKNNIIFLLFILGFSFNSCNSDNNLQKLLNDEKNKTEFLTKQNDLIIKKNNLLEKENNNLTQSLQLIQNKFDTLNFSYDSLYTYAQTRIDYQNMLIDSLIINKDSLIDNILLTFQNTFIYNIDSLNARIKRNFNRIKQ